MILDGYDVLFSHTEGIMEKFLSFNKRIVYNASANNYPIIRVDEIPNRYDIRKFRYFNAGCCIGYRQDLIQFYTDAIPYTDKKINVFNSEQYALRHVFKRFSNDLTQSYIGIDTECKIFQTMCQTLLIEVDKNNQIVI